jgi:hypothetical protein
MYGGRDMIVEFVLVVSVTSPIEHWEYKGHFLSCEQAHLYVELNIPDAKATRCLLEDYIYLPDSVKKRTIRIHDGAESFLPVDL